MKKLLRFLKKYRKESILAPFFKMLEASFELLVPLVMAQVIDIGMANGDIPYILERGLFLLGLALIGYAASVTAQYFSAKAAVGFATELRSALFKHVERISFSETDKIGQETLITRLTSDVAQLQTGVNLTLRLLMRSPFIVFGAMVMAFVVDKKAALVFAVAIPLLSIVVFGIMLAGIPLYKKVQGRLEKLVLKTGENVKGSRVIRAFAGEEKEITGFKEENTLFCKIGVYTGKIAAIMNPVTYVIVNAALIVLIYTGAIHVDEGTLTQGELIALTNYMSQILIELIKLANLIINITKSFASANRISEILDLEVTSNETGNAEKVKGSASVEFDNVSLNYNGSAEPALKKISFKVSPGMKVGIIGGTGSGKTSIVRLIPGFYKPSSGNIMINGVSINKYSAEELKQMVGYVPQKAMLFSGTVKENVMWGKENATDDEVVESLRKASALDFVMAKERGLEAVVQSGASNFSGGQKQRLTIARALIRHPSILIFDDSFSALDMATEAELKKELSKIDDTTMFIISQRTSSVKDTDMILVVDEGMIVGAGTHEELLSKCSLYREIYDSQERTGENL